MRRTFIAGATAALLVGCIMAPASAEEADPADAHEPTGIVVTCQDEKSQIKNKDKAFKVLKSRLYNLKMEEQNKQLSDERKSQVGSGDRSERIRTYNFPQGRVSDHRIGLTIYKLDNFMNGEIDEIIEGLITADRADKMSKFGE